MSCNANPRYTEYWPAVTRAWLKLGITPVCLFMPDTTHKLPDASGGIVHTIPLLRGVPIMPQVLMLRFWASYLYQDAVVCTSDIMVRPSHACLSQTIQSTIVDQTWMETARTANKTSNAKIAC